MPAARRGPLSSPTPPAQMTLGGLARPSAILVLDRIGDDLAPAARRRALEVVAASLATPTPAQITWAQVRAATEIKPAH